MKNLILLVVLISVNTILAGHNDQRENTETSNRYLSITLDDYQNVNYPPGTSFILQNQAGRTILNLEDLGEIGFFKIVGKHSLYVFPSWKNTPDSFEIKNGRIELKVHKNFKEKTQKKKKYVPSDGNVKIKQKRFFASHNQNLKNVSVTFTNGIIFYYQDGKVQAWLNGKELEVQDSYIIKSELGILKISYNPKNGELWYVFTSKEQ